MGQGTGKGQWNEEGVSSCYVRDCLVVRFEPLWLGVGFSRHMLEYAPTPYRER